MEIPDIASLIPQAGSMVIIDRVISADHESLCGEVSIGDDSLFCENGSVGSWVGIEYMAQAIAAHAGYLAKLGGESVKVGFLLGTRRYECDSPSFERGSVLRINVKRLLLTDNGIGSYDCLIHDANRQIACATITVFQPINAKDFIEGKS